MGHFGCGHPSAWYTVVITALILKYLGQARCCSRVRRPMESGQRCAASHIAAVLHDRDPRSCCIRWSSPTPHGTPRNLISGLLPHAARKCSSAHAARESSKLACEARYSFRSVIHSLRSRASRWCWWRRPRAYRRRLRSRSRTFTVTSMLFMPSLAHHWDGAGSAPAHWWLFLTVDRLLRANIAKLLHGGDPMSCARGLQHHEQCAWDRDGAPVSSPTSARGEDYSPA